MPHHSNERRQLQAKRKLEAAKDQRWQIYEGKRACKREMTWSIFRCRTWSIFACQNHIDEIARLNNGEGKDLCARLKQLESSGALEPDIVSMAHQIRELGRNGAHAEWQDVSAEHGGNCLSTLREILHVLYIVPAEREKRKIANLQKSQNLHKLNLD